MSDPGRFAGFKSFLIQAAAGIVAAAVGALFAVPEQHVQLGTWGPGSFSVELFKLLFGVGGFLLVAYVVVWLLDKLGTLLDVFDAT